MDAKKTDLSLWNLPPSDGCNSGSTLPAVDAVRTQGRVPLGWLNAHLRWLGLPDCTSKWWTISEQLQSSANPIQEIGTHHGDECLKGLCTLVFWRLAWPRQDGALSATTSSTGSWKSCIDPWQCSAVSRSQSARVPCWVSDPDSVFATVFTADESGRKAVVGH